jgi:hypothetical protein
MMVQTDRQIVSHFAADDIHRYACVRSISTIMQSIDLKSTELTVRLLSASPDATESGFRLSRNPGSKLVPGSSPSEGRMRRKKHAEVKLQSTVLPPGANAQSGYSQASPAHRTVSHSVWRQCFTMSDPLLWLCRGVRVQQRLRAPPLLRFGALPYPWLCYRSSRAQLSTAYYGSSTALRSDSLSGQQPVGSCAPPFAIPGLQRGVCVFFESSRCFSSSNSPLGLLLSSIGVVLEQRKHGLMRVYNYVQKRHEHRTQG